MANKTTIGEGLEVIAGLIIYIFCIISSPLWVPVWLLGAAKIYFRGHSPEDRNPKGGW